MTDNEIIKALGYCKRSVGAIICTSRCPMYKECDSEDPQEDICGLALDLIDRQKTEIERLLRIIADKEYSCMGLASQLKITNELLKTAKSEVIKEFLERLKEKTASYITCGIVVDFVSVVNIDNIAKELMKGGEK